MACGSCGGAARTTAYEVTLRTVEKTVAEVVTVDSLPAARIKVAQHAAATGGSGTYKAVPKR